MQIFTSYFAQARNFPSNLVEFSIARYTPAWYIGYICSELSPTKEMLDEYRQIGDEYTYIDKFNRMINERNPHVVVETLLNFSKGNDVVLLCYEKSGSFCHRHLVADWITQHTAYRVSEWNKEIHVAHQLTLF